MVVGGGNSTMTASAVVFWMEFLFLTQGKFCPINKNEFSESWSTKTFRIMSLSPGHQIMLKVTARHTPTWMLYFPDRNSVVLKIQGQVLGSTAKQNKCRNSYSTEKQLPDGLGSHTGRAKTWKMDLAPASERGSHTGHFGTELGSFSCSLKTEFLVPCLLLRSALLPSYNGLFMNPSEFLIGGSDRIQFLRLTSGWTATWRHMPGSQNQVPRLCRDLGFSGCIITVDISTLLGIGRETLPLGFVLNSIWHPSSPQMLRGLNHSLGLR